MAIRIKTFELRRRLMTSADGKDADQNAGALLQKRANAWLQKNGGRIKNVIGVQQTSFVHDRDYVSLIFTICYETSDDSGHI